MGPIDLTAVADTTDQDILANVVQTLQAAMFGGNPVFASVTVCRDPEQFFQLKAVGAGAVAGVQAGPSERSWGTDASYQYTARMAVNVVVGTYFNQPLNGDLTAIAREVENLVDLARAALLHDPMRGGLAIVTMWGGKLLKGTDVNGLPKLVAQGLKANPSYYAMVLPVWVAYGVNV